MEDFDIKVTDNGDLVKDLVVEIRLRDGQRHILDVLEFTTDDLQPIYLTNEQKQKVKNAPEATINLLGHKEDGINFGISETSQEFRVGRQVIYELSELSKKSRYEALLTQKFINRYRKTTRYEKGIVFEKEVAELYSLLGADKIIRNRIIDGNQIDIYAEHKLPDGSVVTSIIECKNYSKNVGIEDVSKFTNVFKNLHYAGKADKGIIVSKTGFTAQSRQAAESFGVELFEFEELKKSASKRKIEPLKLLEEITSETTDKKYVFVIMPFDESFDDIYYFGIRGAVEDANYYCERVDEIQFTGDVLEKINQQMKNADIIVAEMTGKNPNVFYEVGLAHAYGKKVILLVKDVEDVPFDLRTQNHIVYGGRIRTLREKLTNVLKANI